MPKAKPALKKGAKPAPKKGAAKKGAKGKKQPEEDTRNHLLVARPKNFAIGNDLDNRKRDVTRFVLWPKYIQRQRQKRVLERRLKVPPALNQFRLTLDKQTTAELFKLMAKYKPETRKEKQDRLKAEAEKKKADPKAQPAKKKGALKYGIQQVTRMIEEKRAKLVVIAADVDPIEVVIWLPALCKAQGVPYCIVGSKAALGRIVGMKTCTCAAFDSVRGEDAGAFGKLEDSVNSGFLSKYDELRKKWGGLQMGRRCTTKSK
eukprot:TRINITY_DN1485_c0_g1_i3.p2 TRINITY_DN1485_c0_g1~~TRINITY_DN1485_c0_g1_i3.p2  ORF type:complete len:285 (+),score=158.02 TRINITY_DN1485_c0_g1_i3:75-857(+)